MKDLKIIKNVLLFLIAIEIFAMVIILNIKIERYYNMIDERLDKLETDYNIYELNLSELEENYEGQFTK